MKKSFLTSLTLCLFIGISIAQDSKTHMYETIYLTPKLDKINELNDALSAHNKKYHGEGNYYAFVQSVITGRKSGDYVWLMGPGSFGSLDSRPAEGGHDDDWSNNVLPNVAEVSQAEYWERDDNAYYTPEGFDGDKLRIRFHRIKRGKNGEFRDLMNKIAEVYKAKKYNRTFSLYWNQFPTARGRNVATINGFENWAMFDENGNFGADFNAVHGEGTFSKWREKMWAVVEWTDNEVRQNMPKLSGAVD